MNKLGFFAFLTVACMYVLATCAAGCYVGPVDSNGEFDCIPGEVTDPVDCNDACQAGSTHTVCNESGTGTSCRTRPGQICSVTPPAPCGGASVGDECEICGVSGITACVGGVVRCVGDHASSEICDNGLDDDCDGVVDEDCGSCTSGDNRSCGTNVGACVLGTQTCASGSWGSCEGALGPSSEICDGVDNNCDGVTDEGCLCTNGESRSCGSNVGACVSGTSVCTGGAWGSCVGGITPRSEVCGNGLDDDCDGSVDEDCGECAPGETQSCTTTCGTWGNRSCSSSRHWNPCSPPAEICDGVDNNCNGTVDETCSCVHGTTRSCGTNVGICAFGTETCSGGAWGSCVGSVGPTTETCNGVDDDCDGTTDEGCSCTNGATRSCGSSVGICATGTETCSGGAWGSCSGSVGPRTETCNGLDDDCDGSVDEGGVCGPTCTPTTEICDGVDNDCDGVVDEDAYGNEFVGSEVCFTLGPDMAPIETYDHTRVEHADLTIFGCDGTRHTARYVAGARTQVCVPLTSACGGWLAATYSDSRIAFGPVGNIGTWYQPATSASCSLPAMSFHGMRADDPRLSGCETIDSNVIVFGRRPGTADRSLQDRSWITYDPSGVTWPDGTRVDRLMIPVRAACAMPGEYPPDHY